MIVYGYSAAKPRLSREVQSTCGNCGKADQRMLVLQRYFHIFWIPVFPLFKKLFLECKNCKAALEQKKFPPELKNFAEETKRQATVPIQWFSGLVVIALIFGGLYLHGQHEQANTREYVLHPAKGDLVVFKFKDKYRIIKIESVLEGLIGYSESNYEYDTGEGAKRDSEKRVGEANYMTADTRNIPVSDYQTLDIYSVER